MRIPPNPISIRNHILRAHYQLYVWTRCLQQNIENIQLENNGWIILDGIPEPFWFKKVLQMPPVVSRSNQRKSKPVNLSDPGESGHHKRAKQKIGDEMLELYELEIINEEEKYERLESSDDDSISYSSNDKWIP